MFKKLFRVKYLSLLSILVSLIFTLACAKVGQKSGSKITVKGSDTMVLLGQSWAEKYGNKNKNVVVQVTGGGSGVGIAALLNGTTDLANASRPMKQKEKDKLKANSLDLVEIKTALDGLSVYLNKSNKVKELSFSQLSKIYRGKVRNWKELGGNDAPIIVYGRDNSSGTYAYFKNNVLNKQDFADFVQTLPGTSAIVNAVAKDKNGIGYGGKAYSKDITTCKLKKEDGAKGYLPSNEDVQSGNYPLSRYLFIYTTKQIMDKNKAIKKYIDWILSKEGQSIVKDVGYYPMR